MSVTTLAMSSPDPIPLRPRRSPPGGSGGPFGQPPPPGAGQPALNVPPATLFTILLMAAMFLILRFLSEARFQSVVLDFAVIPARIAHTVAIGGLSAWVGDLLSLLTYAFLHTGWLHLLVNVGFLLAFGSMVERLLGGRAFVILFLLSSIAGALTQIVVTWGQLYVLIGASAGVAGCFGAFLRIAIRDPARRRMAINFALVMVALNVVIGVFGGAMFGGGGAVAWQAHLGGAAAGALLIGLWLPPRRQTGG